MARTTRPSFDLARLACVRAAVACLILAGPRIGLAQSVSQQATVLTHRLMSPYCQGLLLADCRSEGARELRAEIASRLESGQTAEVIEADLLARFGPSIRTEPEFDGIGLVAWLAPVFIALGGLAGLVLVLRQAGFHDSEFRQLLVVEREDDARMRHRLEEELDALD